MTRDKDQLVWTPIEGEPARFRSDGSRTVMSLTKEDIDVAYQPIVDLRSGAAIAVEALVRCKLSEYKSPPALFTRAEQEGACGRVGRVIREVAFERAADRVLFVNIHPEELSSRWLVRPDDPICFHDTPVYLEITESATFEYFDLCLNVLKEICSRTGARLVVDDMGAGYSNLKRMLDLHPEIVKFDLTLIRGLDKDRRQQILVTRLVSLCVDLGAKVVVEGVETIDELKAARDTGAHMAQGFFLARPGFPVPPVNWPL